MPRLVDTFKTERVIQLSCGAEHTGCITDGGDLLMLRWSFVDDSPSSMSANLALCTDVLEGYPILAENGYQTWIEIVKARI